MGQRFQNARDVGVVISQWLAVWEWAHRSDWVLGEIHMAQRVTDLVLSALATVVAFGLSWPFLREFKYWAESRAAWWVYFVVGFVLAFYVFYVFLRAIHTLFRHDALVHAAPAPESSRNDQGSTP